MPQKSSLNLSDGGHPRDIGDQVFRPRRKGQPMRNIIYPVAGVVVLGLAMAGPAVAGNGNGIVCEGPDWGGTGNPGQVLQQLWERLDLTPPEIAEMRGWESVGEAIETNCTTPGGPKNKEE
jgi:hypothetical protein